MWLEADPAELRWFLEAAEVYWAKNLPRPDDDAVVVVEAFHQDVRVNLRNLAMANAIRRIRPARLVVLTGVEQQWRRTLWRGFDTGLIGRLARSFGASDVVDVWRIVLDERAGGALTVAGRELPPGGPVDTPTLTGTVDATYCRLFKVPRLPAGHAGREDYRRRYAYGAALSTVYERLFGTGSVVALVTSHVDYDQWGLAVESARRAGVPVIHTQQTGCLKAYGLFPESDTGTETFRAELTRQIGAVFDRHVWRRREELRPAAELVSWRAKVNLGRPSWWRGGGAATVDLADPAQRARLRGQVAARLGFDADRPIVAVFNHAVSDALGTNREALPSLADWFADTAGYAAADTAAQWLFLDHPSQGLYDSTGFFDSVARTHRGARHLHFRRSSALSKNALWSVADLGVTVRGSVSNELPAYGIPVVQAGWSEWSACGLSMVADGAQDYWRVLGDSVTALAGGAELITEEQVRRARLWLWLYRSGSDVVTPLVPHWEVWPANDLLRSVRTAFRHIESDADPLFEAVRRMWTGREPMLTRLDLAAASPNGAAGAGAGAAADARPGRSSGPDGPEVPDGPDGAVDPVGPGGPAAAAGPATPADPVGAR
ncbi:hypothetical protein [Plantactinospora sp. KBS50]|uniref:hypothetical protein n=1 Tax=Plantactinospora sp. KBS50 TaxID=2024580 RepID=UPI001E359DFE|nr:hypothetical protein [Plantactinospora sp. KBS50]